MPQAITAKFFGGPKDGHVEFVHDPPVPEVHFALPRFGPLAFAEEDALDTDTRLNTLVYRRVAFNPDAGLAVYVWPDIDEEKIRGFTF